MDDKDDSANMEDERKRKKNREREREDDKGMIIEGVRMRLIATSQHK